MAGWIALFSTFTSEHTTCVLAAASSLSGFVSTSALTPTRLLTLPQSQQRSAPVRPVMWTERVSLGAIVPNAQSSAESAMEHEPVPLYSTVQPPERAGRRSCSVTFSAASGPKLVTTMVKPTASPWSTSAASAVFWTPTSEQATWNDASSWLFWPLVSMAAETSAELATSPQS